MEKLTKKSAVPAIVSLGTAVWLLRRTGTVLERGAFAFLFGRQALKEGIAELKKVIRTTKRKFNRSVQLHSMSLFYPLVYFPEDFKGKKRKGVSSHAI